MWLWQHTGNRGVRWGDGTASCLLAPAPVFTMLSLQPPVLNLDLDLRLCQLCSCSKLYYPTSPLNPLGVLFPSFFFFFFLLQAGQRPAGRCCAAADPGAPVTGSFPLLATPAPSPCSTPLPRLTHAATASWEEVCWRTWCGCRPWRSCGRTFGPCATREWPHVHSTTLFHWIALFHFSLLGWARLVSAAACTRQHFVAFCLLRWVGCGRTCGPWEARECGRPVPGCSVGDAPSACRCLWVGRVAIDVCSLPAQWCTPVCCLRRFVTPRHYPPRACCHPNPAPSPATH